MSWNINKKCHLGIFLLLYRLKSLFWRKRKNSKNFDFLVRHYFFHFYLGPSTGWSIWYCPILNEDCGNFSQISKRVFWVILITNFDTFCYLKSDFWYSKKIFCPKIMIILRVPPMKKKISSSLIWKILPDNKMYQNFHYKSYFQTYLTPRIGPQ